MNAELAAMLSVTRRLPRVRGMGVVANAVKRFYLRQERAPVDADVFGFQMELDPAECVDGSILFYPHLYDPTEIRFIQHRLKPGDCFLDVGANIGFYSLIASKAVGESGKVLAIEADPFNYEKMTHNFKLNGIKNVNPLCLGVSDKSDALRLSINTTGNRGGNSFLSNNPNGVMVECKPLIDILSDNSIRKVNGAKFDIEGFEFRVLKHFFSQADSSLFPEFIIIEQNESFVEKAGGNSLELLLSRGYRIWWSSKINHILTLD